MLGIGLGIRQLGGRVGWPIGVSICQRFEAVDSATLPSAELTLDHVIPRARSGESAWENLVACCHGCNNKKGSRTPEEAGMKLARQPKPFSLHTSRHLMRMLGKGETQWHKYLFF